MRQLVLTLVFVACQGRPEVLAQTSLVLIIDTVVTPDDSFHVYHTADTGFALLVNERKSFGQFVRNRRPQFIGVLSGDIASGPIRLPLDTGGGELTISISAASSADTMRIARYEVFDRCIRDTSYTCITWYDANDTGYVFDRSKCYRTLGPKPRCRNATTSISLSINGITYNLPLQLSRSCFANEVNTFHGYKPRGCSSNEDGAPHHRQCKSRFHGRTDTFSWVYKASLTLLP